MKKRTLSSHLKHIWLWLRALLLLLPFTLLNLDFSGKTAAEAAAQQKTWLKRTVVSLQIRHDQGVHSGCRFATMVYYNRGVISLKLKEMFCVEVSRCG